MPDLYILLSFSLYLVSNTALYLLVQLLKQHKAKMDKSQTAPWSAKGMREWESNQEPPDKMDGI